MDFSSHGPTPFLILFVVLLGPPKNVKDCVTEPFCSHTLKEDEI